MERPRKEGKDLVYRCAQQHSEPRYDKRGAKVDELQLTPLELIARTLNVYSHAGYDIAPGLLKLTQKLGFNCLVDCAL